MLRAWSCLLLLVAFFCAGCRPTIDLTKGLKVTVVSSGWYDAGIVNGQNKLVPSITLTLTNVSNQRLNVLQLNALFRRVNEPDEWGSAFLTVAGSEGLAPADSDARTRMIRLRGSDLADYLAHKISKEEALQRIEVRVF